MTEQGKEARRAYKREWARRNPDKIREQQRRYWDRRGESEKLPAGAGEYKEGGTGINAEIQ